MYFFFLNNKINLIGNFNSFKGYLEAFEAEDNSFLSKIMNFYRK